MKLDRTILVAKLTVLFAFFMALFGCHNRIKSNIKLSQADINFNMYKHFSWPDYEPLVNHSSHIHPTITDGIEAAALQTLEAKGYQFVLNSTSADLIVSYALSSSNEEEYVSTAELEIDNGTCIRPLAAAPYLNAYPNESGPHSTMILSVFDVDKCAVIWQARINTQFSLKKTKDNQNREIKATVKKLFNKFPKK